MLITAVMAPPAQAAGTPGVIRVKDIAPGPASSNPGAASPVTPGCCIAVGDSVFFGADGTEFGSPRRELWRSDGTVAGTHLVKAISRGPLITAPAWLTAVGDTLLFVAFDSATGRELWRSDGTEDGTMLVKDIRPGIDPESGRGGTLLPYSSEAHSLVRVGDRLLFVANDGVHGPELWRSDGAEAGTTLVKDIRPGAESSGIEPRFDIREMLAVGDWLYFVADDGVHGRELWRSDGTEDGTVQVSDINPGSGSSSPRWLATFGDDLYFVADDGARGFELWRTDGTEAGTALAADLRPGAESASPAYLTALGEALFLTADDGVHGRELWRTDGTAQGSALVRDIDPGRFGFPVELTVAAGTLFFLVDDGVHGYELWRTDGTAAGTVLVKDIRPGRSPGVSVAGPLTAIGDQLYLTADDGVHGSELWRSDGTEAGTVQVADINRGDGGSHPTRLTTAGGTVFFAADNGVVGNELYKLGLPRP